MEDRERGFYGVQFHPEVVHTPNGQDILKQLPLRRLRLHAHLDAGLHHRGAGARIRAQVGDARRCCGLSGGVDSSVAALLVHKAIGDQLTCVFVDQGMMRHNEAEQVVDTFRDALPRAAGARATPRSAS